MQRLSASEEFFPIPALGHRISSSVAEEFESAVQASLLKVDFRIHILLDHYFWHMQLHFFVSNSKGYIWILSKFHHAFFCSTYASNKVYKHKIYSSSCDMLVIVSHTFVCPKGLEMIDYSAHSFGWNYHIFMEQKQSFLPFFR